MIEYGKLFHHSVIPTSTMLTEIKVNVKCKEENNFLNCNLQ